MPAGKPQNPQTPGACTPSVIIGEEWRNQSTFRLVPLYGIYAPDLSEKYALGL